MDKPHKPTPLWHSLMYSTGILLVVCGFPATVMLSFWFTSQRSANLSSSEALRYSGWALAGTTCPPYMIRLLAGGLSMILALLLGSGALGLLLKCILPWCKAPSTTHVTWMFAGMQFTGWQLFVPFGVLVAVAAASAVAGVCILKSQA